jgi:hypothetical protein
LLSCFPIPACAPCPSPVSKPTSFCAADNHCAVRP